jgi:hypothetical protein
MFRQYEWVDVLQACVTVVVPCVRVFSMRRALPPLPYFHRIVLPHGHFAAEEMLDKGRSTVIEAVSAKPCSWSFLVDFLQVAQAAVVE